MTGLVERSAAPVSSPSPAAVTLHDVAREAGVSLATASRVLNGSTRRVADSYRDRVERAAERLGYTANLPAQATARGTAAIIALLVADIADPYFAQLAAGVARGADAAGLVVTIAIAERGPEREAPIVRALRGQRPRGLILAASRTTTSAADGTLGRELAAFAAQGGRVVALGRGAEGIRSVAIDNFGGARAMGRALTGLGYRRAIVLAAAEGVLTSDDRVAGFADGFGEHGDVVRVHRGGLTRESARASMSEALAVGVEPGTVVFGVTDVVAIGAMSMLREAGRVVGDDVALCGFDDIPTSRDVTPGLTTVRVPLEEVGFRALRAAVDDRWDPVADPFALEVLLRDSTPRR